jgi:hypothetical protein
VPKQEVAIMDDFDVVIVGSGVAGGALATRLARDGFRILMIERTLVHVDRIRGENILPWGVHEATRLGILDTLLAAGGHYNSKAFRFGVDVPIEVARANRIDLSAAVPGVRGAMSFGHPRLCDTLGQAAKDAGATLLRGVSDVAVEPGSLPTISFEHEGGRRSLHPRLVVGADGRGSAVARQQGIGLKLSRCITSLPGCLSMVCIHGRTMRQPAALMNAPTISFFRRDPAVLGYTCAIPWKSGGVFPAHTRLRISWQRFGVPLCLMLTRSLTLTSLDRAKVIQTPTPGWIDRQLRVSC